MRTRKNLTFFYSLVFAIFAFSTLALAKASKTCKWTDEAKLRDHMMTHVTYPATGKAIKETCKKEMPEEFTKAERKCFEAKLKNKKEYKSADEAMAALGMNN